MATCKKFAVACPASLQCMDKHQETQEEVVKRMKGSGYLCSMFTNFDQRANQYTNNNIEKDFKENRWDSLALEFWPVAILITYSIITQ